MRYIKSFANDAAIQAAIDDKSLGKPYVALNESAGTIDWNSKEIDYSGMYLTIEALSGGTFYVRNADVSYSVNGAAWETTTGETALSLNQGDEVRFKGTAGGNALFSGNTLSHNVYGNIESLEYGDDYKGQTTIKNSPSTGAFGFMFSGSTGTRNVENLILPATTLKGYCYYSMFNKCGSITKAPELPATALTSNCYAYMFQGCASLTTAPDLPAPTLSARSYYYMFNSDTALRYIKCLATNPDTNGGTAYWVQRVIPNVGTFVKKAGVTWPTGNNGIPSGWTVIEE